MVMLFEVTPGVDAASAVAVMTVATSVNPSTMAAAPRMARDTDSRCGCFIIAPLLMMDCLD
jgi:hypothetical protein